MIRVIKVMKFKSKTLISISTFLILYLYLIRMKVIDISIVNDNHFNLITVNSVFAGFLFSALALIVGLSNDKILIRLERADFMDSIYKNIIRGITTSIMSIATSIFNIFVNPSIISKLGSNNYNDIFIYFMPAIELFFLMLTICIFMFAVRDVKFIIKSVRHKIRGEFPNKDDIQKTIDLIK